MKVNLCQVLRKEAFLLLTARLRYRIAEHLHRITSNGLTAFFPDRAWSGMNSTFDPLVGQVLDGRYEIVAKVARGGMATVYRARDQRLSRPVAVKVMRSDLGEDDEFAAKFDREARSAAVLNHPNVVGIFDQGSSQGQPYIVMEFIEGETLRRVISRESPLAPKYALEIFEQIAAALACAHESGVVHRDIKPENVLITDRGHVKVADFGLARQVDSPQMTATGVLVGTASYLPPELVTHARPDGRSDVYSAGVLLFEMLTGKKPHTGENNYQIAYRHVNVDIEKPSQRLAQLGRKTATPIPDYLDALVLAATRRDPRQRIADGRELLNATRRVRQELLRTKGSDSPVLAELLRPQDPAAEAATEVVAPRGAERPRPVAQPVVVVPRAPSVVEPLLDDHDGLVTEQVATPEWEPARPEPAAVSGPRSQRTPVFPQLHISQDPVYKRRRGLLAFVVVMLLAFGTGFGSWWWFSGRYTTIPAMTAITEADATKLATANDLKVATASEHSETVATGQVIRTSPGAGERKLRGETVTLVISLGPERFAMPEVVGVQQEEATKRIAAANLKVGKVTKAWSEDKPLGEVLDVSQKPGTQLARDTAIDLTVSQGREPIKIPDHTGGDTDKAVKELESLGFKVKLTTENSSTVEAGKVIRQSPKDGTGYRNDEISVVKSLGPVMVTIPEVRMLSKDEAAKKLQDLGLVVEVEQTSNFPVSLNLASGTNPGQGTSVAVGSTVKLYVS